MKQIALSVLLVFVGTTNIYAQTAPINTLATKNLKSIKLNESSTQTITDKDSRPQTKEITPASLQDPTNVKTSTEPTVTANLISKDPTTQKSATQDQSNPTTPTAKITDKTTDQKTGKTKNTTTQKTAVSTLAAAAATTSTSATTANQIPTLNSLSVAVQPFSGSASLPITISVPPGRGGIQPSVALVYNSELPESFAGVGWNLDLGSIQRSTKKGPPKYNSSDTFVLMQNGSTANLVWDSTALMYRQEIEGAFAKITSSGSGATQTWIMTDKKGTKYYFGQTAASRQDNPGDATFVFGWALDRVEDIYGNYMTITYIKDGSMLYPDTIQYTGNSQTPVIAPFAKVVFKYATVARSITSYKTSFLVSSNKLLDTVNVFANNVLLTKYKFNYQQSVSSKRYLLASVVQYGADGASALPAVTFTYQGDVKGFNYESDWTIPGGFSFTGSGNEVDAGIRIADINADAYPDLVRAYTGCINSTASTLLNTKFRGFSYSSSWIYPTNVVAGFIKYCGSVDFQQHPLGTLLADVDGDLWPDVIRNYVNKNGIPTIQSEISNKVGGFTDSVPWRSPSDTPVIWESRNWEAPKLYQGVNYVDVNGDGFTDIVISRNSPTVNHNVYINQAANGGTGWVLDPAWTTPSDPSADFAAGAILADLNGDGLPDIVYMAGGPTATIFMNNGHGWTTGPTPWDSVPQQWSGLAEGVAQLADINGDGLVDVIVGQGTIGTAVMPTDGYNLVMINTGSGWYDDNSWSAPIGSFSALDTRLLDANADGVMDYMGALPRMGTDARMSINKSKPADLLVRINNGLGVTTDITYESSAHYTNTFLPFIVQVVKSVTVAIGSESYTTGYYYSNGLWAADTHEFRGFGIVTVSDPDGNNVKTTYLQDRIFKGMVASTETYDLHGVFISKTVNTWDKKTLIAGDAAAFPFIKRVDNYLYENSPPAHRTAQEFFYDESPQYGNLTKTIEYGEVDWFNGADIGYDERITQNTYVNNAYLWILGLPSVVGVTTNYVQLGETYFYYDNSTSLTAVPTKGQLTKRVRWAGSGQPAPAQPADTYAYDTIGNLTKSTDPMGNNTTITYDPLKVFPLTTTNALGHVVKTEYYGVNGVALSDTTGYAGLWGQVKSVTDVNNQMAYRVYDTFGRMIKSISPLDSITYPSASTDYLYGRNFLRITSHVRRTSGQAPTIDRVDYYDGMGRLIQSKSPTATAGQYVVGGQTLYNTRGLPMYRYISRLTTNPLNTMDPMVTTDPMAMTSYDGMGRVTRSTNPDGTFATTEYMQWVTIQKDERGARTDYTHDAYGRVIKVEEYSGYDGRNAAYPAAPYALYATTMYGYDGDGKLTSVSDAQGNTTTITYDGLGRKISMKDPDMGTWIYTYDLNGNLLTQKDNKGQTITFTYDALNRLKTKKNGTALNVAYTYDDTTNSGYSKGRLSNVTYTGGSTKFVYDVMGRETQSTKTIDGNPYTVKRVYDTLNNVTQITYPDSSNVFYQYNSIGQLQAVSNNLSVMPPLAMNAAPGNQFQTMLAWLKEKTGQFYTAWMEPKVLGVKEAEAAVPATLFVSNIAYNLNGQATIITYGNGTVTTQTYNSPLYRLNKIRTVNNAGVVLQDLSYTYDAIGNILSITDAKNTATQTFNYDHRNRLTQAVEPAGYGTFNYSYDAIGNIVSKEGVAYTYSKTNAGPHAVTSLNNGTTLTYDLNGNMTTMVKTGDSKAFTYDVENRLIDVKKNGVTLGQYFYDGDGGRTAKIVYKSGQAGNNTCFLAGTKITMADGSTKSIEEIKVGDSVSSYDVKKMDKVAAKVTEMFDGETTKEYLLINSHLKVTPNHQFYSKGKWTEIGKLKEGDLLFDQDGKEIAITKIEKVESQNSIQVYNLEVEGEHNYYADGILVHNKLYYNPPAVSGIPVTSGVITRYVGALAEETKGAWVNHVFLGSTKIATVTASEVRYYLADHLGSTNVVTNATGTMIELNEYKPFGEFSKHNQFGTSNAAWYYFTGKPLDDETGLMFYGARYYSPVLGRFITPDTVVQATNNPQTLNRYSYCNNNPVNNIDPSGHSWFSKAFHKITSFVSRVVMPIVNFAMMFAPFPFNVAGMLSTASYVTGHLHGESWGMISRLLGYASMAASAYAAYYSYMQIPANTPGGGNSVSGSDGAAPIQKGTISVSDLPAVSGSAGGSTASTVSSTFGESAWAKAAQDWKNSLNLDLKFGPTVSAAEDVEKHLSLVDSLPQMAYDYRHYIAGAETIISHPLANTGKWLLKSYLFPISQLEIIGNYNANAISTFELMADSFVNAISVSFSFSPYGRALPFVYGSGKWILKNPDEAMRLSGSLANSSPGAWSCAKLGSC